MNEALASEIRALSFQLERITGTSRRYRDFTLTGIRAAMRDVIAAKLERAPVPLAGAWVEAPAPPAAINGIGHDAMRKYLVELIGQDDLRDVAVVAIGERAMRRVQRHHEQAELHARC